LRSLNKRIRQKLTRIVILKNIMHFPRMRRRLPIPSNIINQYKKRIEIRRSDTFVYWEVGFALELDI
jgi:hypothetical protein